MGSRVNAWLKSSGSDVRYTRAVARQVASRMFAGSSNAGVVARRSASSFVFIEKQDATT